MKLESSRSGTVLRLHSWIGTILVLTFAFLQNASAYTVANNLVGANSGSFLNWTFYESSSTPVTAPHTDHGRTWAVRLTDNGSFRTNAILFHPPDATAATRPLRTLLAEFDFSLEDGSGGYGVSFNFADTAGVNLLGPTAEAGLGNGLTLSLLVDKDAPYGTCGRAEVKWRSVVKGNINPQPPTSPCYYNGSFPNYWHRARITVDAAGQMTLIMSTVTSGGTVTALSTNTYTLENWDTAVTANWRFMYGARTGNDSHRMRMVLDRVSLSGDTAPVFVSVPASVTFQEDQASPSFSFTASDYESTTATATAAVQSGAGVVSSVTVNPTSASTSFTVQPVLVANASGPATIRLTLTRAGLTATRDVPINVTAVNDPPTLSAVGPATTAEDTAGTVTFTPNDPDSGSLTITSLTSDNQALIPNANFVLVGGGTLTPGQVRTLRFTPAANANGTCNLTFVVSDGSLSASRTFAVTVTAVNDAPTISGLPATVTLAEDTTATQNFTVQDVDSPVQNVTVQVVSSSNTGLLPTSRITPGGTGGTRSLTLAPQPNQNGSATIQVRVGDGSAWRTNSFTASVTAVNDSPTAGAFAGTSRALSFAAGDDYVTVGSVGGLPTGNNSHTIEAWINPESPSVRSWVMWLGQQGAGAEHWLLKPTATNKVVLQFGIWAGAQVEGPTLDVGTWQHVATVWNATLKTYSVYVNGIQVGQTTGAGGGLLNLQNTQFSLGRAGQGGAGEQYFAGGLDEVRVWNRALLPDEIRVQRGYPLTGRETGLLLYWRFDEGQGLIAYDSAAGAAQGGASDGLILNGPQYANPPGTARFGRITVDEDNPTPIWLPGFDAEVQNGEVSSLTWTLVTPPQHGALNRTTGNIYNANQNPVVFTPETNYNGADSFTYYVRDVGGLSNGPVTVLIQVSPLNDPPTLSVLPSQVIEESSPGVVIPFTISDAETALTNLQLSVVSADPALIPIQNLVINGAGSNRSLTITPAAGEIGTTTITVTVADDGDNPLGLASRSFQVRVLPKPSYALVDLGELPGRKQSFAAAVNAEGWITGQAQSQVSDRQAVVFKGLTSAEGWQGIGTLGGPTSAGFAINDSGIVAGFATRAGKTTAEAALWGEQGWTGLGFLSGGTLSEARGLNNNGEAVGLSEITGGGVRAFLWSNSVLSQLPHPAGANYSEATDLSDSGLTVGYARYADGSERALEWAGPGVTVRSNLLAPDYARVRLLAVNAAGVMVGYAETASGLRTAFRTSSLTGTNAVDLGLLSNSFYATPRAINEFNQIVGQSGPAPGSQRAFFHSAGKLNDLNDLIHDTLNADGSDFVFAQSGWVLNDAAAINDEGFIAGTGTKNGIPRAFLAVPAWIIGRSVARPEGAVARLPEIELIRSQPGDTTQNSFIWSSSEQKLYAVRPVIARLKWFTVPEGQDVTGTGSNQVVNTSRIISTGIGVWPKNPSIHVVSVPSEVVPPGVAFDYAFQQVLYSTRGGVSVDPSTKRFVDTQRGYSVLHYLRTDPLSPEPNPLTQPYVFDVVKSVLWPDVVTQQTANVGDVLTEPTHFDYGGRNGFIYYENAFYDGAGLDRAYDRATRLGSIIPVNTRLPSIAQETNRLVVIWYHTNRLGVSWSDTPVEYTAQWSVNAARIIIASALGSGLLPPTTYREARVYNQPDPLLPGFNPNEEHALMVGERLYAVRSDLNPIRNLSETYALLKYREPVGNQWRIKPFLVLPEGYAYDGQYYTFTYPAEAGQEIAPPLPLSAMQLCEASYGVPGRGPWWEDYHGKIYARAAGPEGSATNIVVRYYYPLQPGFWYDLDGNGTNDVSPGQCLPWLNRLPHYAAPEPHDITYHTTWPTDAPVLEIGSSLLGARNGLPGVKNMAKVQLIYDDLSPEWAYLDEAAPEQTLARLYDPISARTVPMAANWVWPSEIERVNINGREYFPQLPYALKARLSYDPVNHWLSFQGVLNETFGAGPNPLLLPNVISPRELNRMVALAPNNAYWALTLTNLYWLTRNPNHVDLLPADGQPDQELRIGFTTRTNADGTSKVVFESFGDGPKSLTAGLAGVPAAQPRPGKALRFADGDLTDAPTLADTSGNFTMEFWAFPEASRTATPEANTGITGGSGQRYAIFPAQGAENFGSGHAGAGVSVGTDGVSVFEHSDAYLPSTLVYSTTLDGWTHVAVVYETNTARLYLNGRLVRVGQPSTLTVHPSLGIGNPLGYFQGTLDELRVWSVARSGSQIRSAMNKRLNGAEDGLIAYWRFDEGSGSQLTDASRSELDVGIAGTPTWVDSTAPAGIPPRYITLAENDDSTLPGLPVGLHVIQVDDGPYTGDLKVLPGDNVFDERVTVRHSSDFGATPEQFEFEWYFKPDAPDFDQTLLPNVDPVSGQITDLRGWQFYATQGTGINDLTIGEGGESSLLTLGDNWFICRYRGYTIGLRPASLWSDWVGEPGSFSEPRAQLVEGWIKRVLRGLNPFDARTQDFHAGPVNTYASMLVQAGRRYEGPIAFNPSVDNLNSIGLIEAYQTVLERGVNLSIEGAPPVDFEPANNALLLVSSKISDLYMLLGNEAYADAQDPTIGFGTSSGEYGTLAPSIFAFQNQLDSLLDEELMLLRGRDNRNAGVRAAPVYNRAFWNFTLGEGEVAYQQVYNISDQTTDGFLDEQDARVMFPQGHGDAWGHYLTAIKSYYRLMRHPLYTWRPRAENVLVAGVAVQVDFLDERKFARAAAARAKTGREIVSLEYRAHYVEDPAGQWQGYKDTDLDRAWGVDEWARRVGQGAYFDWLAGNAVLPAQDPNPAHTGIQKIDRTTVGELIEVASHFDAVQTTMDEADAGLNPLGVAKGAIPFDIDPTFLEVGSTAQIGRRAVQGLTQFDQILERAVKALDNASTVWDQANKATELLRRNQDSADAFARNVRAQEYDYKSRLIEIFGYPYAGDIGAGRTYPSGYDGPDLYHHMYVDTTEITGQTAPPNTNFVAYFTAPTASLQENDYWLGYDPTSLDTSVLPVIYPLSAADYGFTAPPEWGQRRAPGELQMALSDLVQANAQLKLAMGNYDGLLQDIQAGIDLLTAQYDVNADKIQILTDNRNQVIGLNAGILATHLFQLAMNRIASQMGDFSSAAAESLPESAIAGASNGGDMTSAVRGALLGFGAISKQVLGIAADVGSVVQIGLESSKEVLQLQTDIKLQVADQRFEVLQRVKELEALVRNESTLRLEAYTQAEVVQQTAGRYLAKLAEGQRLISERVASRKATAADVSEARYEDMTFRIFRNDALQKYRAAFDLAARYVYLAANAYDFEVNFLGTDQRAGQRFLTDIVRQRNLGQLIDGNPAVGTPGLADSLARMEANWSVLKSRFGVINPQIADTRFSLREEMFRLKDGSEARWREELQKARVDNLWSIPEFRRFCRPFAPESAGPQPGLVIRFPTTITFGMNYFGWPLAGGDSSYDPSQYSTKIAKCGIWFSGSDPTAISATPRFYLVPIGMDVMRSPTGNSLATREWRIVDQVIPVPFPIGTTDLSDPDWVPLNDSLGGSFAQVRRYGAIPARHDAGIYAEADLTNDNRLIGRSAWNTEWMLIIPGGTLLNDPNAGLDAFINTVSDVKIYFQTYSYSGD